MPCGGGWDHVLGEHMLVTGQWTVPLASSGGHLTCVAGEGVLDKCQLTRVRVQARNIASGNRAL